MLFSNDAPIIPAFQLPSQRLSTSTSDVRGSVPTTFDRIKRYGSMRSQELAETVAKVAGRAAPPGASTSSTEATPTRKLVSQWEKYNSNIEKIQEEQVKVAARLAEVSKKDEEISSELKKTVASSDEEENLLQEHMQLLNEKDALVRKSEYLNVLEQLADVEHEIADLQKKLGQTSKPRTEDDKKSIDKMMEDLVELVNRKDKLSHKLIQQEAEDEEMIDRDRRTLEAAAHFKRGFEQPVSASRRLITWLKSEIRG
ncbi:unnamed protein product [Enterobius vermicularis]|uniref:BMERB domain-containing protein n=1 Tax=Enterobius vermicularis TaxID=51028 RepID=A0A0N4VH36_ENTVE|nr:unnamed protein product [Enterobius vermicularis]